jgi:hypothetical protein
MVTELRWYLPLREATQTNVPVSRLWTHRRSESSQ